MEIHQITENKKDYMDILLLADPQEDMIERYLDEGEMFVLSENGDVLTVCVVLLMKNGNCELKNIATAEEYQRRGFGRYMVRYICEHYSKMCSFMYVGTGNSRQTLDFYRSCGFVNSHIVADFFVDNYREPIYEDGIQLIDMIYLKKQLDLSIDVKKVVDLALEAGKTILKNGGEIFRVEETIKHICGRFHVDDVETFILSHAIFVSAENEAGETYTRVMHLPLSSPHLGIVAEVNNLSREISAGHVGIEEASERLKEIEKIPPKRGYFQVLAARLGSGAFAFLLGSTAPESIVAFFIGCILYVWVLAAKRASLSKIVVNIVGGAIITSLAVLATRAPGLSFLRLEGMIIGAIMPLISGVAFVNAIREIADSDFLSGTVRMIDALLGFAYIAIGVGVTLAGYHNIIGGVGV